LLIASPRRVTSYHMDSNTNFLFQLHGDKRLTVFDGRSSPQRSWNGITAAI